MYIYIYIYIYAFESNLTEPLEIFSIKRTKEKSHRVVEYIAEKILFLVLITGVK